MKSPKSMTPEAASPLRAAVAHAPTGDAFLLKGASNLTLVQRIAAWILGLFLFTEGLTVAVLGVSVAPVLLVGVGFMLLGAWVFRNGFPRKGRFDIE